MRKAIFFLIDLVAKIFIFIGALVVFGTVGAEENNLLTDSEFISQIATGFGIALTAAVVLIISNKVDENYADS